MARIPIGESVHIDFRTKTPLGFRIRTKGGTEIEIVVKRNTSFKFCPGVDIETVETFDPPKTAGDPKRAIN